MLPSRVGSLRNRRSTYGFSVGIARERQCFGLHGVSLVVILIPMQDILP